LIYISGWWLTYPSEKNISQIGSSSQLLGKIKNVPTHQPSILVGFSLIHHPSILYPMICQIPMMDIRPYYPVKYALWLFKIAMEHGPFIYLLKIVIFHGYVK
jgi:hypothetical protein